MVSSGEREGLGFTEETPDAGWLLTGGGGGRRPTSTGRRSHRSEHREAASLGPPTPSAGGDNREAGAGVAVTEERLGLGRRRQRGRGLGRWRLRWRRRWAACFFTREQRCAEEAELSCGVWEKKRLGG